MNETYITRPIRLEFILSRKTKSKTLASGNHMVSANDAMHHMVKSQVTRNLREVGSSTVQEYREGLDYPLGQFTPDKPCHIIVTICPPTRRRMDAPNWYPTIKPLIDGMTDDNLFSDDDDSVITSMTFVRGDRTTNKQYRIVIDIYPGTLGGIRIG